MACPAVDMGGGLSRTLRAIDCRAGEGTAYAFSHLFGDHGALLPALTGLLTLYVAFFAVGLLTGRSRIGLASLTPRMMTLGIILTFATSWLAYSHVVWTLAVGAPDQIASVIAGTRGSATTAFADKVDMVFSAIAQSSHQTPQNAVAAANATANGASSSGISILSPQGMLWISALMLLVGTVGVLVTAKIVLAALLALGPVFILFALFPATHGLFEGWAKATVSSALVPLFTVLIGGAMLTMIAPLIRDALLDSQDVATRSATALFLAATVYMALMLILARTAGMIVAGWRIPWLRGGSAAEGQAATPAPAVAPPVQILSATPTTAGASERVRAMMAALPASGGEGPGGSDGPGRARAVVLGMAPASPLLPAPGGDRRLQGVGSRFRTRPDSTPKGRLS